MISRGPILALDLSITRTGWAIGSPGDKPESGSLRFGREGHSLAAQLRGCRTWVLTFCESRNPRLVVFEAPLAPSFVKGKTTTTTVRSLMGLAAIVEECLYESGRMVTEASVSQVRRFFLGTDQIKSADAKAATFARCVELGWQPRNDDAADACALWAYQTSIVAPDVGLRLLPMFARL